MKWHLSARNMNAEELNRGVKMPVCSDALPRSTLLVTLLLTIMNATSSRPSGYPTDEIAPKPTIILNSPDPPELSNPRPIAFVTEPTAPLWAFHG